jgi:hypothetical protein
MFTYTTGRSLSTIVCAKKKKKIETLRLSNDSGLADYWLADFFSSQSDSD